MPRLLARDGEDLMGGASSRRSDVKNRRDIPERHQHIDQKGHSRGKRNSRGEVDCWIGLNASEKPRPKI
ncbi:hypothetical protein E2C01_050945 [Portunus trituberculatus]|uniref:Uncharacterized protein n=1 Tax=Portunus trituberculatus TaxID=210409 RepID=A0A5B7GI94_PORTR|nr:hypothetical protein [Portunus trituberculatus]